MISFQIVLVGPQCKDRCPYKRQRGEDAPTEEKAVWRQKQRLRGWRCKPRDAGATRTGRGKEGLPLSLQRPRTTVIVMLMLCIYNVNNY